MSDHNELEAQQWIDHLDRLEDEEESKKTTYYMCDDCETSNVQDRCTVCGKTHLTTLIE